jgi:hypothetical protein
MIDSAKESHKRKLKGEKHQYEVLDLLLEVFHELSGELSSCHMCSHGEDIKFSDKARDILPISIECKTSIKGYSRAYKDLEQAQRQTRMLGLTNEEPTNQQSNEDETCEEPSIQEKFKVISCA